MLPVQLGGNVGLPVLRNLGEFVGDIDLIHGVSPVTASNV
jgi:hypothetical protein